MRAVGAVVRRLGLAAVLAVGAEVAFAYLWPAPRQTEHDASFRIGNGSGEPLRLAALGDSTLTGPGVEDPDDIWIRSVARQLADKTGRPVELLSLGVGGATSADVARNQLPAALDFGPHLVVLSVGANDVIRGMPMRRLASNLDLIVSGLRQAGSQVIMSGVGNLGTIPRLAPPLRQMAARLGKRADRVHQRVAERHGAIKAEQWRWASGQFQTRSDVWSADRFHPNAAGHQIWATTCWEVVEPLCVDLVPV